MAKIEKNGSFMALPINIKRGNPIPVDTTTVWYSLTEMEEYAKNGATAYVGQVVSLVNETNNSVEAYMISNTSGDLVKLAQTTKSGNLASDVATLQNQVSDLLATVGTATDGETAGRYNCYS